MKKNNKKGFTLAELLIVIAIIAVLVAIAIPVFSSSIEKAEEAVDAANIRAIKAMASVDLLEDGEINTLSYLVNESGDIIPEGTGDGTVYTVTPGEDNTFTVAKAAGSGDNG